MYFILITLQIYQYSPELPGTDLRHGHCNVLLQLDINSYLWTFTQSVSFYYFFLFIYWYLLEFSNLRISFFSFECQLIKHNFLWLFSVFIILLTLLLSFVTGSAKKPKEIKCLFYISFYFSYILFSLWVSVTFSMFGKILTIIYSDV